MTPPRADVTLPSSLLSMRIADLLKRPVVFLYSECALLPYRLVQAHAASSVREAYEALVQASKQA